MARTIFTATINGKESKFKLRDGKFYKISPDGNIATRPYTGEGLLQLKGAARKMQGSSTKQMMDYYSQVPSSTKATVSSTGAGTAKKRPGTAIKKKTSKANRATSQGGRTAAEVQREREKAMFPYKYNTTGSDALSTEKLKRTAYSERKPTTKPSTATKPRVRTKVKTATAGVPLPKKKPADRGRVDQSKKRAPKQESKPTSIARRDPTRKAVSPTSTKPRVRTQKAKNITAGPNTGFGPKGNIFPSNAAERRALMAKFGGTGSAAAKAAAAGKQGNLKRTTGKK